MDGELQFEGFDPWLSPWLEAEGGAASFCGTRPAGQASVAGD